MVKRAPVLLLLALVLVLAGCGGSSSSSGGGGGSSDDAASLVPADALAYLTVDTDLGSGQLTSAQQVLDKFPAKQKLLQQLLASAAKQGVDLRKIANSVGSVLDVAVLRNGTKTGAVGFAKPSDEQAFDAQLGTKMAHTTVSGWTVFAETQAFLDQVKSRTASLADDPTYKDAVGSLPGTGDAIVRAYAPGAALRSLPGSSATSTLQPLTASVKWYTAALTSQEGSSFKLEAHVKSSSSLGSNGGSGSGLRDELPSGSLLALSLTGGSSALPAGTESQLGGLSQSIGIDLQSLIGILRGPVIAFVKPGTPIPAVTLAAKPPDPASAEKALGSLLQKVLSSQTNGAAPQTTTVDGVPLQTVNLGPVALYWGRVGDQVVVTDDVGSVSTIKSGSSSGKLSDDSLFKDAAKGAGMPDSNQGFLYLDAKDAVPLVEGVAALAGQNIPQSVQANLTPLRSALVYGSRDGDVQTVVVYASTN